MKRLITIFLVALGLVVPQATLANATEPDYSDTSVPILHDLNIGILLKSSTDISIESQIEVTTVKNAVNFFTLTFYYPVQNPFSNCFPNAFTGSIWEIEGQSVNTFEPSTHQFLRNTYEPWNLEKLQLCEGLYGLVPPNGRPAELALSIYDIANHSITLKVYQEKGIVRRITQESNIWLVNNELGPPCPLSDIRGSLKIFEACNLKFDLAEKISKSVLMVDRSTLDQAEKLKVDAEKVAAELKVKQDAEAKAAADAAEMVAVELQAKQAAEAKAAAAEKAAGELKAAEAAAIKAKQDEDAKAVEEEAAGELLLANFKKRILDIIGELNSRLVSIKNMSLSDRKKSIQIQAGLKSAQGKIGQVSGFDQSASALDSNVSRLETQVIAIEANYKKTTITCLKGKSVKKVTAVKPVCPKGYKKK